MFSAPELRLEFAILLLLLDPDMAPEANERPPFGTDPDKEEGDCCCCWLKCCTARW
jgi:hypothetical protein